ncbi:MAG: ArsB/NhaD family transporter [Candidatus Bipolaricaulota bacterium]|nr:ArsB/NhaD family transporter [Candidatus Bipolaricaulota bacterium]MDW8126755.1 ArsB/NhaD family transporter [Candidatus Bipolaricaulota bacterium]
MSKLIASGLIFAVTYGLIFTEKVHRTIAAVAGAVCMIVVGQALGFYSWEEAISAIDFNTLALLLGMMIIVGLIGRTGFFQYLAVHAARSTRGRPWALFAALSVLAGLVSTMLDNVTTMVMIAPVTFSVSEILEIDPTPLVLGEVLFSNFGGTATLVGDPPNILIGSAASLSFMDFLVYLAPIVIITSLLCLFLLRFIFRRELSRSPKNVETLAKLEPRKALTEPRQFKVMLAVLFFVIGLYFVHDRLGFEPGLVALLGAALALLALRPRMEEALAAVEWEVLLFFAGLFVVIQGVEASGLLEWLMTPVKGLIGRGEFFAALTMLWIGALLSSLGGSVPVTMALIPVVQTLIKLGGFGTSLWWGLALGVGLGANGTLIGGAANVLSASLLARTHGSIAFKDWFRQCTPVAVVSWVLASFFLWLFMATGLIH